MRRFFFLFSLLLHQCLLFAEIQNHIFREYDIRGIVGSEFDIEDTYDIACAIGTYLVEQDSTIKKIAIGADGRIHSPLIKDQVRNALIDQGFDVLDIGVCTTPVMYFSLYTPSIDAGLMITASHNPGEYNGIKIRHRTNPVFGPDIKRIRDIYISKQFVSAKKQPGNYQEVNMVAHYVDCLVKLFPHLKGSNLRVIIDCGNGAVGSVLPLLLEKMQWNHVQLLYPEIDGTYPNHVADPTVEKYMQDLKAEILSSNVDFGVGFDGDGDRMAPMTKSGQLIKGDQLLAIYSKKILEENPGSSIVFDVSSSLALHHLIKKWGGVPVISATGIAQVKKKMIETKALLGGEISCHTIFNDLYFGFDDGVYSMLRLFELLQKTNRSLDEWVHDLPLTYSSILYRLPCERELCLKIIEVLKDNFSKRPGIEFLTIDGLRVHFPYGWVIVRASNTEPVISMRFEGNTHENLERLKKEFYELITPYFNCSAILT